MITPPKCSCPNPVTLECVHCYPTFTPEEKAYVRGHTHAAYQWARTPRGDYTDSQMAAYYRGFDSRRGVQSHNFLNTGLTR